MPALPEKVPLFLCESCKVLLCDNDFQLLDVLQAKVILSGAMHTHKTKKDTATSFACMGDFILCVSVRYMGRYCHQHMYGTATKVDTHDIVHNLCLFSSLYSR